jgi:hypothetical protein
LSGGKRLEWNVEEYITVSELRERCVAVILYFGCPIMEFMIKRKFEFKLNQLTNIN